MTKKYMPWDDQPPKKEEDTKRKSEIKKPKTMITPSLLKWLFYSMLGLLFLASILITVENYSKSPKEDPAAAMRRAMGITDNSVAGNDAAKTELDNAIEKISSDVPDVRIEGLSKLMEIDSNTAGPRLFIFLKDPSPMVRAATARLCGSYRVQGAHNLILPLIYEEDADVRSGAVDGLSAFGAEPGFLYLLTSPLAYPKSDVVISAIDLWNRTAVNNLEVAKQVIIPVLRSNDERILETALDAISARFTSVELTGMEPYLLDISKRLWGTPVGDKAKILVDRLRGQA